MRTNNKEKLPTLEQLEAVFFDLDGTVYRGSQRIPGANETISFFRRHGKDVYFTTNNSTKTRRQIMEKLLGMGVNCAYDEIITSGYVAALYIKQHMLEPVYVFGSENLEKELEGMGVSVTRDEQAKYLLIGFDPQMTYKQLSAAVQVALHAKKIIACNRERLFPGENGRQMPGCGAMTAPVEWCTGRCCDVILGKPCSTIFETLLLEHGYAPEQVLVVGDTYESDVAAARSAGCRSVLIGDVSYEDTITVSKIGALIELFHT